MVPGYYINGALVVAGIDFGSGDVGSVVAVQRLGSGTGDVVIEVIPTPRQFSAFARPDPPKLPAVIEPEPPPRKKSWKQQQKELPKFLRGKR